MDKYEKSYCFLNSDTNEDLIERYVNYLLNPSEFEDNIYYDHDKVNMPINAEFYKNIGKYIEKMFNKNYFCEWNNGRIELRTGIFVNDFLHTDQFGFSAPEFNSGVWGRKNTNHPYDKLLNDKGANIKNISRMIARCIVDTRTIGGCFIWPNFVYSKEYNYNMMRGDLDDRVDFTLLEIKAVLNDIDLKNNKLLNCLDKNNRVEEFKIDFTNFDDYVHKMSFEDFVDEKRNIIDVYKSKINETDKDKDQIIIVDVEEFDNWKWKRVNKMNCDEIMQMINNVRVLVLRRTKRMVDIINKGKIL